MDIHMPKVGGIEATRRVAHPDLMVLLMSTYDVEDHSRGRRRLRRRGLPAQRTPQSGPDRSQPLLTEATGLVETAIADIRRLAHGIYPPLLVSGGLAEALPAVAARSPHS